MSGAVEVTPVAVKGSTSFNSLRHPANLFNANGMDATEALHYNLDGSLPGELATVDKSPPADLNKRCSPPAGFGWWPIWDPACQSTVCGCGISSKRNFVFLFNGSHPTRPITIRRYANYVK